MVDEGSQENGATWLTLCARSMASIRNCSRTCKMRNLAIVVKENANLYCHPDLTRIAVRTRVLIWAPDHNGMPQYTYHPRVLGRHELLAPALSLINLCWKLKGKRKWGWRSPDCFQPPGFSMRLGSSMFDLVA